MIARDETRDAVRAAAYCPVETDCPFCDGLADSAADVWERCYRELLELANDYAGSDPLKQAKLTKLAEKVLGT